MVTEIAYITIDPANAAQFEAAVAAAAPVFRAAEGCRGMRLERVVEDAAQYRLSVDWDSVAHHALAGPFFVGAPRVEHWERAGDHF